MRYIIFCKPTCPFCVKVIDLLDERGLEYNTINFNEKQSEILSQIKEAYDWKTVPMVFEREGNIIKFVGGYTDLVELLGDG